MPVVVSVTLSRCSVAAHVPSSTMIRLAAGGYCGSAFSSRSGRSGYSASSASVSIWRSRSLPSPTDRVLSGQSGSTSAIGRSSSADFQNSQKRYHWR